MKKILATVLLLSFSAAGFSQEQVPPVKQKTKQDYLYKSYKQKNTGFIMLGLGAAAMLGGALIASSDVDYSNMWGSPNQASSSNGTDAGAFLFIAGSASAIGSIFFFVAAGNNKHKANSMTASFKVEKGLPYDQRGMGATYYPAVAIKLPIK